MSTTLKWVVILFGSEEYETYLLIDKMLFGSITQEPLGPPKFWCYLRPNPTKPGTSGKTCFWVNSHKRWLAQNYFQIFKCIFMLIKWEQCILSNAWKNLFKWDFFQTINDGLSLLIPIHCCSKWKTNWPISKKCSEAKIRRCHLQNQPYLEKCLCYKHDLSAILKLSLKWLTWY